MADSNLVTLGYVPETTEGQLPAIPELTAVRFTNEGLVYNIQNTTSGEIRPDRQVTDLIQTGASVSGPLGFEFSVDEYDPLLRAALMSTDWSVPVDLDAGVTGFTIAFAAGVGTITDTDTTGTLTANLSLGQFVRLSGFANAANNGFFRVRTVTSADEFTVDAAGMTMVAETSPTANISASWIKNGTSRVPFSFEKGFNDAGGTGSNEFFQFLGLLFTGMTFNLQAQQVLTGEFQTLGREALGPVSATVDNSGTYTAPSTGQVLSAGANVADLKRNGALIASGSNDNYVQAMTINLANNLREQYAVGSLPMVGIGVGKCDVTGTQNTYFATEAIMQDYLAGAEFSQSFIVRTGAGATATQYLFDMPRCKYESGEVVTGGQDQDVLANMRWRALRYSTHGDFTFAINKFRAT